MPRNEEEVIRNIITLSNQLKASHDLPQVILTFEGQSDTELVFTVIWLRVLKGIDRPLQQIFEAGDSFLKFDPTGSEESGCCAKSIPGKPPSSKSAFLPEFLRSDHSVDLVRRALRSSLNFSVFLGNSGISMEE